MTAEVTLSPLTSSVVDDVWFFFDRLPDGDRTFVKEPVTDRATVVTWLDDDRASRFVAKSEGRIVGYFAVYPGVGWSRHVGEIRLVVDPQSRRMGIGHHLARRALREAVEAGLTKVVVEVAASQDSTIALFTGLGFVAEALLVDHVQDPEGNLSDLIVLANHIDIDADLVATVGLDQLLD